MAATPAEADRGALRVEPVDPAGGSGVGGFVALPRRLHAGDPAFVPPLDREERRRLDPRRNPHFQEAEIALWMAWRGGRPVGRISAQIDRVALRHADPAAGAFGDFEAAMEDAEAAAALLRTAEAWLRERGMARARGPFEPSINDRCGLLVEGFDTPPMLMMGHHPPHLAAMLEANGYRKARDLLAYHTPVEERLPPQGVRLIERLGRRVHVRRIAWRRYRAEIDTIIDIFNDAWAGNWGFVPLTDARLEHLARSLRPILIEDLVAIAEIDGEPAAMMVALPNVNEAIADLDGRLLPFGWARLLWRLKATGVRSLRVPLMGVRRRHHGRLTGAALMTAMFDRIRAAAYARGMREAELSWVLEENRPMRHIAEHMGARVYKRYRIYEKDL
jgi:GNAT superfamily N-acetyltransferase